MNNLIISIVFSFILWPVGTKQWTDKEFHEVHGPVKTIIINSARYTSDSTGIKLGKRSIPDSISFSKKGNMTEHIYNKGKSKAIYFYNSSGKKSLVRVYDTYGHLCSWQVYSYDTYGFLISRDTFSSNSTLEYSDKFQNNSSGNILISEFLNLRETEPFSKDIRKRKYDSHNNLVESESYDSLNLITKTLYRYDGLGRLEIQSGYRPDSTLSFLWIYSRDTYGNVIGKIEKDSKGEVQHMYKWEYLFDNRENWIQKTEYQWEKSWKTSDYKPTRVTYRNITYYPD